MNNNTTDYNQEIIANLPDIVVAVDTNFLIIVANNTYQKISETVFNVTPKPGDKFGKVLITNNNSELLNIMIDNFSAALAGTTKSSVYKLTQGLLANKSFDATFYPIKNTLSVTIGAVCVAKDVTDRVEKEERLNQTLQGLNAIFNLVPAWIFIKDMDNKYIKVNKNYANALGKPEEEIIGKTPFDFYPKEKAEVYWKDDRDVISTGVPKNNIVESLVTKNGVIWSRTERVPYRDIDGNIIGTIGFVVDVSQQKNAELDTETKNAELKNFNKLFMDRENKMVELKQEIEKLKQKSG